ncbi:MAG: hypothetical protein JSU03_10690 [Bacteroidetes bacterium]|nr:hypothetical protein [Bacteroidota bacterium]MBS1757736.1 hypothetical protein [Bacteroidota bacterium]
MTAQEFYTSRIETLTAERKKLLQKKSIFAVLRLGSIALIIAVFYFLWSAGVAWVIAGALLLLIIFTRLVLKDIATKDAINNLSHLIKINEDELKALEGNYYHFDNGAGLNPSEHYYANDMDILGHASLYQFINRTTSEIGSRQLAAWLLAPADTDEIIKRQNAFKELKNKTAWLQQLQAYGKEQSIKIDTTKRLKAWFDSPPIFLPFKPWQWLRYVLPAIIAGVSVAAYFDAVPMQLFYAILLLYAIIAFQIDKYVSPIHEQLSKMVNELNTLSKTIKAIESENFQSPLLTQIQQQYAAGDTKASYKLSRLKKILDRLDLRYNIVISAPLNIFLLWNLQQVLDLEKWKRQYAGDSLLWFHHIGIFEALNSFTTLHFNNPQWVFPGFKEPHFFIEANNLGHPLINKNKRVNNFININNKAEIMLVTGSNMAGKSTYLRSVGINVILAMAGAPVCADVFNLSPVQLISSMRIADNLEESTSTFYAELKKLKTVIDKVNNHEHVFILLDEILRGTNSLDRHTGSAALIKQLIQQKAAAVLATHDVQLAALQNDYPENIVNYHFDVQVNNEELYFDYKLKPGVCTSLNASILMKKIGIEL